MNFDLTDDQVALRDGIRSLLEGRFPMERVRDGFDRAAFARLAFALGVESALPLLATPLPALTAGFAATAAFSSSVASAGRAACAACASAKA